MDEDRERWPAPGQLLSGRAWDPSQGLASGSPLSTPGADKRHEGKEEAGRVVGADKGTISVSQGEKRPQGDRPFLRRPLLSPDTEHIHMFLKSLNFKTHTTYKTATWGHSQQPLLLHRERSSLSREGSSPLPSIRGQRVSLQQWVTGFPATLAESQVMTIQELLQLACFSVH